MPIGKAQLVSPEARVATAIATTPWVAANAELPLAAVSACSNQGAMPALVAVHLAYLALASGVERL